MIKGIKEFTAKLNAVAEATIVAAMAGVYQHASNVMTDAKGRAPLDMGDLRRSGYVSTPDMRDLTVEIGFGGTASDYAVIQHERMDFAHDVGEAKFLERAFDAAAPDLQNNVAAFARQALSGRSVARPARVHDEVPR